MSEVDSRDSKIIRQSRCQEVCLDRTVSVTLVNLFNRAKYCQVLQCKLTTMMFLWRIVLLSDMYFNVLKNLTVLMSKETVDKWGRTELKEYYFYRNCSKFQCPHPPVIEA